ncbi:MAG: hypothetical protein JW860_01810 [Sedimentisphaerales bacterium]|nr:hypothetical protein [Sedimentisphaerales bacterium]
MSFSQSNQSGRWAAALLGAVIACTIGGFFLLFCLPKDQVLCQAFRFSVSGDVEVDQEQWGFFVKEQELVIARLVHESWPHLKNRYVLVDGPEPFTLNLRFRYAQNGDDWRGDFRHLVAAYISDRAGVEAGTHNPVSPVGPPDYRVALESKLEEITADYQLWQEKLALLQSEYSRLSASCLALEHELRSRQSDSDPMDFVNFVEPYQQQVLSNDEVLKQLQENISQWQKEIIDLDMQAGRSDSDEELDRIFQQRRQLRRQCELEREKINTRREQLSQTVREKFWPEYQKAIKGEIRDKQKFLEALSDRQWLIKAETNRIQEDIELVRSLLGPGVTPESARVVHALTNDLPAAGNGLEEAEFCPVLNQPVAEMVGYSVYSRVQFLMLALSLLVGAGLGLIIYSSIIHGKKEQAPPEDLMEMELSDDFRDSLISDVDDFETEEMAADEEPMATAEPEVATRPGAPAEHVEGASLLDDEEIEALSSDESKSAAGAEGTAREKQTPRQQGWSVQYDDMAWIVTKLKEQTGSAVILMSAVRSDESSPRPVVNLGISLSRQGLKVLIIEADPAGRDLAEIFERGPEPGFYEWRRGDIWASKAVVDTPLGGLSFMPAGVPSAQQQSDDLDVSREQHRWGNLRRNYEVILLYTPTGPLADDLTPGHGATVKLLLLVDGVFMLAGKKCNQSKSLKKLEPLLKDHKAQFLGFVDLAV